MASDTSAIHITDLARPTFSPDAQAIIDGMAAMADYCPLTVEGLHEQASAQTGLTDFGAQDYRERMAVLLQAFDELPHFTKFGRTYAFSLMLTFLNGRLRVIDHLKRHPEVFDVDIAAPLVIAGLPRTGTTHLHSLLAADPALRSLPYWEAQEPLPGLWSHRRAWERQECPRGAGSQPGRFQGLAGSRPGLWRAARLWLAFRWTERLLGPWGWPRPWSRSR